MDNFSRIFTLVFSAIIFSYVHDTSATPQSELVPLWEEAFKHIQFGKIKANRFTFKDKMLTIEVDESASLLMMSFDKVNKVSDVRFQWKSQGGVSTKDAEHENRRDGDDAVFKLGLLLKSDDTFFNPFVPSWLKLVKETLKFPSTDMIYLVVDAKHESGKKWVSPYNDRVAMISVNSHPDETGWWQVDHHFSEPVEVVAVWLMADGDDTHSSFTARIKNIELR